MIESTRPAPKQHDFDRLNEDQQIELECVVLHVEQVERQLLRRILLALANAFRMRVQYYDIARLPEHEEDALGVRFKLFRELLRTSDIVTMHVPLNDSTRHMIGADELALMKPEAIVVNTSRGPVIDEVALTKALAENKLFGAGLDVFDQEPPPPDNPIFKLRNVVLTSHFAGPTWDNHVARFRNAFDNVQRVARGEKPLWVVPELAELMK